MDCDATSSAPCVRTGNLLRATETTDSLVVWGGIWFPQGLIMFLLHLTTCFNLLDAICRQTDRDAMLRAQSQRGRGDSACASISARVFIYAAFQHKETASGVKHSLYADSTEGWQQHKNDWFNDQLTAWLAHWLVRLLLVPQRWGFWGQWGWRSAKMFYWIRSDWLHCEKTSTAFSFAPSPESMSSLSAHAGVLDGCKQHLRCISICTYWPVTAEPLIQHQVNASFSSWEQILLYAKGISWHFSSALCLIFIVFGWEYPAIIVKSQEPGVKSRYPIFYLDIRNKRA